ncbi:uncharacterized protein Smp_201010 [Schistosoma mansoni]|uniref:uncharacterized protein n=1 Tax=Schistosoma mansoni TaxID=6183 RepID=UPI00022DC1E7|nr:uncharacterized protein Smp_201010 [Schistosoma mansoni]|eukprot:XP_018648607.1 uncharacterized protein Smp_201010 [Schistosoma mansoni]
MASHTSSSYKQIAVSQKPNPRTGISTRSNCSNDSPPSLLRHSIFFREAKATLQVTNVLRVNQQ